MSDRKIPVLLQDQSRALSQALSNTPEARANVREACDDMRKELPVPPRGHESSAIRFTLRGEPASKANSREIVKRGPALASVKSKKAQSFEAVALLQIPPHAKRMLAGPVGVSMRVYYASNRPDLDESVVLDVLQTKFTGTGAKRKLVRAGVYLNDRQVKEKHVFWGLDPLNPRVEIVVQPLSQGELL